MIIRGWREVMSKVLNILLNVFKRKCIPPEKVPKAADSRFESKLEKKEFILSNFDEMIDFSDVASKTIKVVCGETADFKKFEHLMQTVKEKDKQIVHVIVCAQDIETDKQGSITTLSDKYSDMIVLTTVKSIEKDSGKLIYDVKKEITNISKVVAISNIELAIRFAFSNSKVGHVVFITGDGYQSNKIAKTIIKEYNIF